METIAVALVLLPQTTWVYYVALIKKWRARKTLSTPQYVLTLANLPIGMLLDVALHLLFCVVTLSVPREVTLSQHLSRLNDTPGWRGDFARWICGELLDGEDPNGVHCK